MRLVVAIDIDAVTGAGAVAAGAVCVVVGGAGVLDLADRQCLSYLIPNKTIKYSINAKNTNSVQDISHTCQYAEREIEREIKRERNMINC